ncbi:low molecular weight phosphotyrosine protein phosphatase [Luteimonas sp. M1R5S18]|jgi:protein-tyrosine phosphatase|uniref:protein-tyrosine-phosphatase n=1 Tax=Luteimonas rhizosphaericola TaxID=3042024 RepID=A0ABT6JG84_9GAMM|nr:low molecular weight protein-tyrosine-phosphatase [Luteimonas rhizosphaericola]MDH5829689.1 low molecular weight phosphotyrosine protein phosphatase [Luteimonas rhizosphaericola]
MKVPHRILLVCLGNICRSPLAEGLLRHHLAAARLGHRVEVDSAGTGGWHAGEPPDRRTIANARTHGIDLSALRARQLRPADYHEFHWLLCADRANLVEVRARAPVDAPARSALLLEWAGLGQGAEVPDPYTGGPEAFEHVWGLVDRATRAIVQGFADRTRAIDA